uniref:Uncharacterized protein n=1 Tax=Oryza barthii TaxID=65489 RepID=A0A0D3HCM5_9ORYZ
MASSLTPSPATSCALHQERLTNEEVDEMIHEIDGGRWINYKEFVKWDYSVDILHDSGSEQDESGDEGDEHPPFPEEVAVHQAGSPPVPPLPAVGDQLLLHAVEAAVRAHHRSPAQAAPPHSLVAAEQVADDPSRFQQRHVPGRVDDVVHER